MIDLSETRLATEAQQYPAHIVIGVHRARCRLEVTQGRLCEGPRGTTFPMPRGPEEFRFEGRCFFLGELGVVALSAAAYTAAGDSAGDGEGAR